MTVRSASAANWGTIWRMEPAKRELFLTVPNISGMYLPDIPISKLKKWLLRSKEGTTEP